MFALDEEKSVEMPEEETPTVKDESVAGDGVEKDDGVEEIVEKVSEEALPAEDETVAEASEDNIPAGEDEMVEEETSVEATEMTSAEESPPPDDTIAEEEAIADSPDETPVVEEEPAEEEIVEEDPEKALSSSVEEVDDGRAWFVVHCYSGYENKVRHNLEQRIETMGMKNEIFDVVVPTEEEIEVKDGKRKTVERRVFPGYILVNMVMSEESWYVVRNTPGVTSFVGMGNEPVPLRPEEVSQIIKRMEADAPRIKVSFRQGERVRIVDGPFNDFRGTVDDIDMNRAKVRVMVNFFGRETPVELDFLQVEKA